MSLISFAVTAKLICVFVFAYADCWFFHEVAQLSIKILIIPGNVLVQDISLPNTGEATLEKAPLHCFMGILITNMSHVTRKRVFGVSTMSHTNLLVQCGRRLEA